MAVNFVNDFYESLLSFKKRTTTLHCSYFPVLFLSDWMIVFRESCYFECLMQIAIIHLWGAYMGKLANHKILPFPPGISSWNSGGNWDYFLIPIGIMWHHTCYSSGEKDKQIPTSFVGKRADAWTDFNLAKNTPWFTTLYTYIFLKLHNTHIQLPDIEGVSLGVNFLYFAGPNNFPFLHAAPQKLTKWIRHWVT